MKHLRKTLCCITLAGVTLGMTGCSSVGELSTSELVASGLAIGGATLGAFAAENEDEGTRLAATAGGGLIGWMVGMFTTQNIKNPRALACPGGCDDRRLRG